MLPLVTSKRSARMTLMIQGQRRTVCVHLFRRLLNNRENEGKTNGGALAI